jgi:hypothetical protein
MSTRFKEILDEYTSIHDISLRSFCLQNEVSYATLWQALTPEKVPTYSLMKKIADSMGIDMWDFVKLYESPDLSLKSVLADDYAPTIKVPVYQDTVVEGDTIFPRAYLKQNLVLPAGRLIPDHRYFGIAYETQKENAASINIYDKSCVLKNGITGYFLYNGLDIGKRLYIQKDNQIILVDTDDPEKTIMFKPEESFQMQYLGEFIFRLEA